MALQEASKGRRSLPRARETSGMAFPLEATLVKFKSHRFFKKKMVHSRPVFFWDKDMAEM